MFTSLFKSHKDIPKATREKEKRILASVKDTGVSSMLAGASTDRQDAAAAPREPASVCTRDSQN